MTSWGDPGVPCRPALFLLLASYFGDPATRCLIDVAAAVELGCLAALTQRGVVDTPAGPADPAGPASARPAPDPSARALATTRHLAHLSAERAAHALAALPAGPARTSLRALTDYSLTRKASHRPDLATLLDLAFDGGRDNR
jgi:geranylgeranyl pyrophosphate synthase